MNNTVPNQRHICDLIGQWSRDEGEKRITEALLAPYETLTILLKGIILIEDTNSDDSVKPILFDRDWWAPCFAPGNENNIHDIRFILTDTYKRYLNECPGTIISPIGAMLSKAEAPLPSLAHEIINLHKGGTSDAEDHFSVIAEKGRSALGQYTEISNLLMKMSN